MDMCPRCKNRIPASEFRACPYCGQSISERSPCFIVMKTIEGWHFTTTIFPPVPKTYWRPSDKDFKSLKGRRTKEGSWRVAKDTFGVVARSAGISLDIGLYDVEFQIALAERGSERNLLLATVEAITFDDKTLLNSRAVYVRDVPDRFDPEDGYPGVRLSFLLDRFAEDVAFNITSKGKVQFDIYGIKLIPRVGRIWAADRLSRRGEEDKDWRVESDEGSITFLASSNDYMLYGPGEYLVPGSYQVAYKLSLPEGVNSGAVAKLDVVALKQEVEDSEDKCQVIVGEQTIEAETLRKNHGIPDYKLHFRADQPLNEVEFRVKPLVEGLKVQWIRLATDQEAIWQHYYHLGGLNSALGPPRSGYWAAKGSRWGTGGSLMRFEGGSIYWNEALGHTFDMTGSIGEYWESMGGTTSFLGFPTSRPKRVTSYFGIDGLVQRFERGFAIYSYIDQSGREVAYEVYGSIGGKYFKEGAAEGKFGFPISGEHDWNPEGEAFRRSVFEGGAITWNKKEGIIEAHLFPLPEVSVVVKTDEAQPYKPMRIQIFARNYGGEAKEGYFSVSFPDPVEIVSFEPTSGNISRMQHIREDEDKTWWGSYGKGGRTYRISYPMIEAVLTPAKASELYSFEVVVNPLESGIFRIESKCSMTKPLDLGWVADPPMDSDKSLGQQKERVYITEVKVKDRSRLGRSGRIKSDEEVRDTIFIAYRRADSGECAERIYARLAEEFGPDRVFLDKPTIPRGANFPEEIKHALDRSVVQLVLIGEGWLSAANPETGKRRLDDSNDLHRLEIEYALDNLPLVIPVLLDEANVPKRTELSGLRLHSLLDQNGSRIRCGNAFNEDLGELIAIIKRELLPD